MVSMDTDAPVTSTDVESNQVSIKFARVLKDFRTKFGTMQLTDLLDGFKKVSYQELLDTYNEENASDEELENWILESKFWAILESLLDIKFVKEIADSVPITGITSYSSNTVLQDKVLERDNALLQNYTVLNALADSANLNLNQPDTDITEMQVSKWLNTTMALRRGKQDNLVSHLDVDAPLREGQPLVITDIQKDAIFFKRCFELLLANNQDELQNLCQQTNNWDFALACCGQKDYVDPALDLHDATIAPVGIKHKLLWRHTIYNLTSNSLSVPETAVYSYLSGDFLGCESLVDNWEDKLQIYLNNLVQCSLEDRLLDCYKSLSNVSEIDTVAGLASPPKIAENVGDILNKLAADSNETIQKQSQHPIRVLIGSVISDRVEMLMKNAISMLNSIVTDKQSTNELTSQSYLLRILTHLAILLQLIYGDKIISNDDYTELVRSYVARLALYRLYGQIPVYISYIPDDESLVTTYAYFLSNYDFTQDDRQGQLRLMSQLNLPTEAVLRETVAKSFSDTEALYPIDGEVTLDNEVTVVDRKLYGSIYWFCDSSMVTDCLDATVMLMRRFLLCGKLQASIEFINSISLRQIINDYKRRTTLMNESDPDVQQFVVPTSELAELAQYQNLIASFTLLNQFDAQDDKDLKSVVSVAASLDQLLKTWMLDLAADNTVKEDDRQVYQELRRLYVPTIFTTLFDLLVDYRHLSEDLLFDQAVQMVNVLADEKYKFYKIFKSTGELKPFLQKFASISCSSFGERSDGIYTK